MKLPDHTIVQQREQGRTVSIRLKLVLSVKLDYFDGHFAEMPILPAVAQLDMARQLAIKYLRLKAQFKGLRQLKFRSPILPETETELRLEYRADQGKLLFEYWSMEVNKSKGVLLFDVGAAG